MDNITKANSKKGVNQGEVSIFGQLGILMRDTLSWIRERA